MFCRSAAGEFVLPMVVYKAANIYSSTDKFQPLDVAIFWSLKSAWRALLTSYKA
jgi:hypothetical protein